MIMSVISIYRPVCVKVRTCGCCWTSECHLEELDGSILVLSTQDIYVVAVTSCLGVIPRLCRINELSSLNTQLKVAAMRVFQLLLHPQTARLDSYISCHLWPYFCDRLSFWMLPVHSKLTGNWGLKKSSLFCGMASW